MLLDAPALGAVSRRIRKAFTAVFRREAEAKLRESIHSSLTKREVGVYVHFPFCKSLCPGCPYFREIAEEERVQEYLSALRAEIGMVGGLLKDLDLKISDVHVGGGTPSLIGGGWGEIRQAFQENFEVAEDCPFGIEANPNDLTEERAHSLAEAGVNKISIGVQSFFRPNLKILGRNHGPENSLEAIENCRRAGLSFINIDMMYLLPRQSIEEWIHDLRLAAEQGVDQITCYPLLVPRYTRLHELMLEGRVPQQPDLKTFQRMYYAAIEVLGGEGYSPLRYYSFGKGREEYSTVEREMVGPLLGFGSGAIGFTGGYEYVNTCSVQEYIRRLKAGKMPIAGGREVTKEERVVRYVSERLGTLRLRIDELEREFGEPFYSLMKRSGYGSALRMGLLLGNLKREGGEIRVTDKGMWQRNLGGWAFVLLVPCRIVEEYLKTPWPLEVKVP
ncbi:MAG: coproporphyrinogen-III oxidase family protein [Candidatus Hadarchaeum sp.]|uniref:coproporphyrinogen-III oxidase family protein n=1 Tax=Candidatus Hadarchaeum sp. TaxID=2883567 RepID=UPI003D0CE91C